MTPPAARQEREAVARSLGYVTAEAGFVVEASLSGTPTEGRPFPGPFLPSLFTA